MSTIPAASAPVMTPDLPEIATTVLAAPAASISFAGLSSTLYRLTGMAIKDATPGGFFLRFDGDAGANYDYEVLYGAGAPVAAARTTGATGVELQHSYPTSAGDAVTLDVTIGKTLAGAKGVVLVRSGGGRVATIETAGYAGLWNNVAALITSATLYCTAGNLAAETTVILEGA